MPATTCATSSIPRRGAPLRSAYQALIAGQRNRFQRRVRALTARGDTTWVRHQSLHDLLESLPVRGVELAGALVRTAAQRPGSVVRSALANTVALIRRTGIAVVVAGIDDAKQLTWWRGAGPNASAYEPRRAGRRP